MVRQFTRPTTSVTNMALLVIILWIWLLIGVCVLLQVILRLWLLDLELIRVLYLVLAHLLHELALHVHHDWSCLRLLLGLQELLDLWVDMLLWVDLLYLGLGVWLDHGADLLLLNLLLLVALDLADEVCLLELLGLELLLVIQLHQALDRSWLGNP